MLWRFKCGRMMSFKIEVRTTQWTKEKGQRAKTNIDFMRKSERTSQHGIQNVIGQHSHKKYKDEQHGPHC